MVRRIHWAMFVAAAVLVAMAGNPAWAGLVGHWTFDETNGTVAHDSSGQGNDGTLVGDPQWVPGKIGGALEFDGDDYVNCGKDASLNVRQEITMSFWFKVEAFQNSWEAFLAKGDGAYRASRSAETGNATHMGISSGSHFDGSIIITDNQWHHWAGTYDGMEARIYIDGVLDTARVFGGPIGDSSSYDLLIGENAQATGRFFHGLLDDIRIYDRGMSEEQLQDLITSGVEPTWVKAEDPDPADGAVGIVIPLFRWSAGETAKLHRLYLGTDPNLTEADLQVPGLPALVYYHGPGLAPGSTYYWRVDEVEGDGVTVHTGDVWSFVTQDVTAYYPSPADGANTASPTAMLTWMPGANAIGHHVYFSDSLEAVTQGTAEADRGTLELDNASFAPGVLDPLTIYHWRVDGILMGDGATVGPVWSFATTRPVDDFESYVDDWETGDAIWEIWIDGLTNGTGAIVGNFDPPFAEQTIVRSGLQSMPLDYNNIDEPFYSEAELAFNPAEDWTAEGADTLLLVVRGNLTNDAAPVYVALEDASGNVHAVAHPDPVLAKSREWLEWTIPFSEFVDAGVNMARIKYLYIGVGDRANPQPDGAGRIYIDDICVTRPAPVGEPDEVVAQ